MAAMVVGSLLKPVAHVEAFGENNAKPSVIDVTWKQSEKYLGIQKDEKECTLKLQVNGTEIPLTISFPEIGGVRIHTNLSGFFEPEEILPISYEERDGNVVLHQESASVVIREGEDWEVSLQNADGETVRTLDAQSIQFGYQGSELKKVMLTGPIAEDEDIFGLGERFNSFSQVGQEVLLWNQDCYKELMNYDGDKTVGYKNVPIIYSSKGYSMFFNSTYAATADIGSSKKDAYSMDFNGPKCDMYFWMGTPQENLMAYTALTGRAVIPPKWALQYSMGAGGQVWDALGKGKHLDVMENVLKGYEKLGTPLVTMFGEQSPQYDAQAYQMLKNNDIKMLAWYWSAMGVGDMYKYAPSLTPDELPTVMMISEPDKVMPGEYIDFSNPNGTRVISGFFKKLWKWGLRGCMVDFGDNVYEDSKFYNGMTGDEMHNFYAYLYNKGYHDAWSKELGDDYILFSRSGAAGSQQWIGQFAGDHPSTFQGLQQAILGGLSASTAGFSLWGSDIGGYGFDDFPPSEDCYIRWMQFGTFSPLMRTHGTSDRNPWTYGDTAEEVFVDHYWLRENLLDTIYSGSISAAKTGISMIQPLYMEYPNQPELIDIKDQYLFCDAFLVNPVVREDATTREVVFPAGDDWVDLWSGEVIKGGQTLEVPAPQERMPVYVKAGAVLPIQVSPETLALTSTMIDGKTNALLVTAGTGERLHYVDESTSQTYSVEEKEDGTIVIHNADGAAQSAVLAYGITGGKVTVDGTELSRLGTIEAERAGYLVDKNENMTKINLSDANWKSITITPGEPGDIADNTNDNGNEVAGSVKVWPWVAAGAGVLAIAAGVFFAVKSRKRNK